MKVQYTEMGCEHSLDYCRKLISEGVDPSETLEVYRGEMLCLTMNVGEASKWTIEEGNKVGPRYRKYRELPSEFKQPSTVCG